MYGNQGDVKRLNDSKGGGKTLKGGGKRLRLKGGDSADAQISFLINLRERFLRKQGDASIESKIQWNKRKPQKRFDNS